jgi:uncharacterized BrkB/YihY/UPF0761 family membrane protein
VPAVLLVAVVAGVLIADPNTRSSIIATFSSVLPPLQDLSSSVIDEARRDAAPVSILGVLALLWGTSRFAVAFQDAVSRVAGTTSRRSFLRSNLDALVAVVVFVLAVLATTIIAGVSAFLDAAAAIGTIPFLDRGVGFALGIVPLIAAMVAVAIVYRIVPLPRPRWRSLILPAAVVGAVLTVLARIFIFISPKLIGVAALLGTLASVFAALAWLSLSFQALLLGMAWTADRDAPQPRLRVEPAPETVPPEGPASEV